MAELERSMEFEEFRTYSSLGEEEARHVYDTAIRYKLIVDRPQALFITHLYSQAWDARGEYESSHQPLKTFVESSSE